MSWRKESLSKGKETDHLNQLVTFRTDNAKMKIQLQSIKMQLAALQQHNTKLIGQINQHKILQDRIKNQLMRIISLISPSQMHRVGDIFEILDLGEKKASQMKQKVNSLEKMHKDIEAQYISSSENAQNKQKQVKNYQQKLETKQAEVRKLQTQINSLMEQNDTLRRENDRKQAQITEYKNRIGQFQIQKKGMEAEIMEMKSKNTNYQTQILKKQCKELLDKINVRQDDYLKSYLQKNHRIQNLNNSLNRKNKYDFIFQD